MTFPEQALLAPTVSIEIIPKEVGAARVRQGTDVEKQRVVFHLGEGNKARLDFTLSSIATLLTGLTAETLDIELVASAGGIAAFLKRRNRHARQIRSLAARGVRFCLCASSMRQHGLTYEAFLPVVEIVSSGTAELAKKQALGWVYISL